MAIKNPEHTEKENEFPTGEYFVYEPTGSATHINLDVQSDCDSYVLAEGEL